MTGGDVPPGLVTENESVRHWDDSVTADPRDADPKFRPNSDFTVWRVELKGPVITKV